MSETLFRGMVIHIKKNSESVWVEATCSICGESDSEIIGLPDDLADIANQAQAAEPFMVKFAEAHEVCLGRRH